MLVEVCCETVEGVEAAVRGGADRVELCARLDRDGLTPPADLVAAARRLPLRLHMMIRPRAGAFVCEPATVDRMLAEIGLAHQLGVDGVVLGCLTAAGRVDASTLRRLVHAARPLTVTFHRAIDHCADRSAGLDALADAGVDGVLTAGVDAPLASPQGLAATLALACGRLGVIAAGGVRAGNAAALVAASGVGEIHFSERLGVPPGPDRVDRLAAEIARIVAQVRPGAAR